MRNPQLVGQKNAFSIVNSRKCVLFLYGYVFGILDRTGQLRVGKSDEIITEECLRDLYQSKLHLVNVRELSRKACLYAKLS